MITASWISYCMSNCMSPSDMAVASLADRIAGYNNKMIVATLAMNPVTYQTINTSTQSNTEIRKAVYSWVKRNTK